MASEPRNSRVAGCAGTGSGSTVSKELDAECAALAKATDPETKAHLEASRDEIDKILDPKFLPPAPSAAPAGGCGGE